MKKNFLRGIASLAILSLLLSMSPVQARPNTIFSEASPQEVEPLEDPDLPEGLTSSEWKSIQNQITADISQQAYLKASNTDAFDNFGKVAISGDTLIIGNWSEDSAATSVNGDQSDNSAESAGAAYVFVRDGTTWSQQAYLKASNTNPGDGFGYRVDISGNTIVVGAPWEDSIAAGVNGNQTDNSASNAGAAYVFVRSGTTWTQEAYLKASNTDKIDGFGFSVAISGDTIVVGARNEASNATGVNGNQTDNSALHAGASYVFVRSGSTWSQQAYLKASNTNAGDYFGDCVEMSEDTIIIGAYYESSAATGVNGDQTDNSASNAGAAYVFVRSGTTWTQQAYLKASNTDRGDSFGISVAVSGDTIVVGADYESSIAYHSGASYVFVRNGTSWTQQAYLKASFPDEYDNFGGFVAISGNTIIVGADGEGSAATGVNGDQSDNSAPSAGAAYVFVRSASTWSLHAYLKASNTEESDSFGSSVAISGDTIVVGAAGEDSAATGVNGNQVDNSASNAGAAYVFVSEPIVPPIEPSWLLMYYFAGDNGVDKFLQYEERSVKFTDNPNVDIAIFLDSAELDTYYEYFGGNGDFDFEPKGNLNTGSGDTLVNFMNWARAKSTAPNHALVIIDHGHGLGGVANDDTEDDELSPKELRQALTAGPPLDVFYMHTCLTGNLEYMWEMRFTTNFYVSSESQAKTPASHSYLLGVDQDTTALDLAIQMALSYESDFHHKDTPSTISVVDMSFVDEMFERTNNLAMTIRMASSQAKDEAWNILTDSNLQRFDEDKKPGINNDDRLADLFHFATLAKEIPELSSAAITLLNTEADFVKKNLHWSGISGEVEWIHDYARGVSISLPVKANSFYDGEWIDFATGADWSLFNTGIINIVDAEGYHWGPMVSELVSQNNPESEDEPLPPDPLPLLIEYRFFVPLILR